MERLETHGKLVVLPDPSILLVSGVTHPVKEGERESIWPLIYAEAIQDQSSMRMDGIYLAHS